MPEKEIFQAVWAHTRARRRTRLQHRVEFDGGLENGIDIWGNGYLQGEGSAWAVNSL